MQSFFLFLSLSNNEKIVDSIKVIDSNSYNMRSILLLGQDEYIQFET